MIFKSQKHVFWQALILALIIFGSGIFVGFILEGIRVAEVSKLYTDSEIYLLDIKIQSELYKTGDVGCEIAIQENINFANKVFEQARILDKYEKSSRITESIKVQHKKYDLLRTLFWINSIEIKKRCNAEYHNIVYFYNYNDPGVQEKALQDVYSNLLEEVKNKHGDSVMLIPIAVDNGLSSVDILVKKYNIKKFPSIMIDENIVFTEFKGMEDIEQYL